MNRNSEDTNSTEKQRLSLIKFFMNERSSSRCRSSWGNRSTGAGIALVASGDASDGLRCLVAPRVFPPEGELKESRRYHEAVSPSVLDGHVPIEFPFCRKESCTKPTQQTLTTYSPAPVLLHSLFPRRESKM